jgi:signal transduction histidine kinase
MGRWAVRDAFARALEPARALPVLAVAFGLGQVLEAAIVDDVGHRGVTLIFAVLAAVPLAFAWRAPLASVLTFDALCVLDAVLGGRLLASTQTVVFVCMACMLVLGIRADARAFALGAVATVALLNVAALLESIGDDDLAGGITWAAILLVGTPGFLGRVLRSRNDLNRRLDEQAGELERNRAAREQAAVLAERTRIARELQDVVAHDVSVMLVQAAAAKRTVPMDPERARRAIAAVEETGREALGELRRLLGVLRRGDEELALAPQPSLVRIGALVQRTCAAGLPVELEVAGDPVHLAPGVDAAAFRIVQAALVDVMRHGAATRAVVHVGYEPATVELRVTDHGRADGPAYDARELVGLRERVALYGGELDAGRRPHGGFELRARLPVGELLA